MSKINAPVFLAIRLDATSNTGKEEASACSYMQQIEVSPFSDLIKSTLQSSDKES
jgi:hypothetical protein